MPVDPAAALSDLGRVHETRAFVRSARPAETPTAPTTMPAGVCVKGQTPNLGGATCCAPCLVAKEERRDRETEYAARSARYVERRAEGSCVQCNAPSPVVSRCEPCSRTRR